MCNTVLYCNITVYLVPYELNMVGGETSRMEIIFRGQSKNRESTVRTHDLTINQIRNQC